MTQEQILKYAHRGLLELWDRNFEKLREHPDSDYFQRMDKQFSRELEEAKTLLEKEQAKRISESEGK